MAKNNNLQDLLKSVADAIRTKKGTNELINPQNFDTEIINLPGGGGSAGFTGHVDSTGLTAIGWTEEDIADFQQHVWWNEVDDNWFKVSDYIKTEYQNGNLTFGTISTYANYIDYCPKFNTTGVTTFRSKFANCTALIAVPSFDMSSSTTAESMFQNCYALKYIGSSETNTITNFATTFDGCYSLFNAPDWDFSFGTNFTSTFRNCRSLRIGPTLGSMSGGATCKETYRYCTCLYGVESIDASGAQTWTYADTFDGCHRLTECFGLTNIGAKTKNGAYAVSFANCICLSIDSCVSIIDNLSSGMTNSPTITFAAKVYAQIPADAITTATSKGWVVKSA